MRTYLTRLAELSVAGFLAGASSYFVEHGLDFSEASVRGALTAGAVAVYGLLAKQSGADKDRPTIR